MDENIEKVIHYKEEISIYLLLRRQNWNIAINLDFVDVIFILF